MFENFIKRNTGGVVRKFKRQKIDHVCVFDGKEKLTISHFGQMCQISSSKEHTGTAMHAQSVYIQRRPTET